jgi:hypothetical protein
VSFESELEDPVDGGATNETRTRREKSTYHFFSRRPVDCELEWRIVDDMPKLTAIEAMVSAVKTLGKEDKGNHKASKN